MSESNKRERRAHFRGKARPGRRVEIEYRRKDTDEAPLIQAFTRNIGVGGAFVATASPEPLGAQLRVSIRIPTSERALELNAEVRWVSAGEASESGMGLKFQNVDVEQLLHQGSHFRRLFL